MKEWQLQEAKARLSDLIKQATQSGPQCVTVHGKPTVIVMSLEEYETMTSTQVNFVDFMRESPLVGEELDLERDKSPTRDLDL